jgi:putative addiction module component (TIGR02574 family)
MNTQLLQQASLLDIDEQIELVEAIWNGIVSRGKAPPLTAAQSIDHLAHPDDVLPWGEVKAAAIARMGQ